MFRRLTSLCLVLLAFLTIFWGFLLIRVRPSDITAMKNILREQENASSQSLLSTTDQQRRGVTKEIWFSQEDRSRLHYRIASESSLLTVQPRGNKFELLEKLEKIQCWMQDKLYTGASPMQQIRFFQAKEGLYRFTTQEFLAQSVALSLYRLSGNELPEELKGVHPFLKGIAQDVSFAVSGKSPQFNAQQFKAELNTFEEK